MLRISFASKSHSERSLELRFDGAVFLLEMRINLEPIRRLKSMELLEEEEEWKENKHCTRLSGASFTST